MSVKRFTASTMTRALELVRQDMGPDAIILSTRRIDGKVEIVTSLEKDLPTRHALQNRQFKAQFDEELDQPLATDVAWQLQDRAEQAMIQHSVTSTDLAPHQTDDQSLSISPSMVQSAQRLSKDIEAAREKMFAAKHAEKNSGSSSLSDKPDTLYSGTATSLAQDKISVQALTSELTNNAEAQLAGLQTQFAKGVSQLPVDRLPKQNDYDVTQEPIADLLTHQLKEMSLKDDANEKRLAHLQAELATVRLMLEERLKEEPVSNDLEPREDLACANDSANVTSFKSPPQASRLISIKQNLHDMGFSEAMVANELSDLNVRRPASSLWKEVMHRLSRRIPVDTTDKIAGGGVFALVGATGVGKTTTIAKLAARHVIQHGPESVAIITTDTHRVGAFDQLKSLGRILNVSVKVADGEARLHQTLNELCTHSLVLIDTAGFRQGDPLLKAQDHILASCFEVQRILVMAANSQAQWLKASTHAYGSNTLAGCIVSKLDESCSLGELLSLVIEKNMPIMYVTDGQEIPRDLSIANAQTLMTEAINHLKQQKAANKPYEKGA